MHNKSPQELRAGDICLVKFHPGYGSELKKYRPAIVVASQAYLDPRFVLIAPFTTSTKTQRPESELLIKKQPGLTQDSLLLCWYLHTFDTSRIVTVLGHLKETDIKKMRKMVAKAINL
jgi:mRNA-degrading endonuclease toxin of MazEF toxin-antitoxin module